MNKEAVDYKGQVINTGLPLFGDINSTRFVNAVLAGVIGGAGVSAAANLLRSYKELRQAHKEETDNDQIVLTLPSKAAESGYDGMKSAKPGESKITANSGRQFRESGKYGKSTGGKADKNDKPSVKCALTNLVPKGTDSGHDAGPNSVGTIVANALGLTVGGLLSYDVVSRLFDRMNERRLKRKLEAAQQAYVNAMTGASKRAEAVLNVLSPVEHVFCKEPMEKSAGKILDAINWLADRTPGADAVRYPVAAYVLALLAGTGATSYITKKVLDREFPEEKLKKDINRPTRIVFRTAGAPQLMEGAPGQEKAASTEVCAAVAAMLPIYKDVVEGEPSRTLAPEYVKLAEAAGTDPAGLMKMAKADMMRVLVTLLQNPRALWNILKGTNFGLDFSKQKAVNILKAMHPDVLKTIVDQQIDSRYSGGGLIDGAKRWAAKWLNNRGNTNLLVDSQMRGDSEWGTARAVAGAGLSRLNRAMLNSGYGRSNGIGQPGMVASNAIPQFKNRTYQQPSIAPEGKVAVAEDDTLLHSNFLGAAVFDSKKDDDSSKEQPIDEKDVMAKVRRALKGRRSISVSAGDPAAAKYIKSNKAAIKKLLARLNATGAI